MKRLDPKPQDRNAGCSGKKQYKSMNEANGVIRYMHRYKGVEDPMRAYYCRFCHKVHIGSNFEHD